MRIPKNKSQLIDLDKIGAINDRQLLEWIMEIDARLERVEILFKGTPPQSDSNNTSPNDSLTKEN